MLYRPRLLRFLIILLAAAQAALPALVSVAHARDASLESESRGTSRIEAPGQHASHALPVADCGLCTYVAAAGRAEPTPPAGPASRRELAPETRRLAVAARAGEGILPPPRAPPIA